MKNTGIVHRIDDLGRIVLPKEIRCTLQARENTPFEIWMDGKGSVVLKKHNELKNLVHLVNSLIDDIEDAFGNGNRNNNDVRKSFYFTLEQADEFKKTVENFVKTLDSQRQI